MDANDWLSVQVHPDDAYGLEYEGELGKIECWYIIAAEPGAEIIYETQQSSDTTYRVYDFDRKDDQGNLRELHLEKSIDVLTIGEPANSRLVTTEVDDLKSTLLVASDFFAVYKWEISGKADFEKTADYSLFSVLDGQGSLNVDGQDYDIAKGGHFILPSDVQAWEIEGNIELVVSHP